MMIMGLRDIELNVQVFNVQMLNVPEPDIGFLGRVKREHTANVFCQESKQTGILL